MRAVKVSYAISGFISLGYQLVWLKHFVGRFGSSTLTFVLVIGGFIFGLGAGALASRSITAFARRRLRIDNQLVLYGWIEIAIAVATAALLLEPLISIQPESGFPYTLRDGIYEPTWGLWLSRLPIAAACVVVPCFLMGTTYPLLCQAFAGTSRFPAALYAWNTLGACTAVLLSEFVLFLQFGTWATYALLVSLNLALGLFFIARGRALLPTADTLPPAGHAGPPGGRRTSAEHAELLTADTLRPVGHTRPRDDRRTSAEHAKLATPSRATGVSLPYGALLLGAIVSGLCSGALEADAFRRIHFAQIYNGAAMAFVSFWAIAAIFVASVLVDRLPRLGLGHVKALWLLALVSYLAIVYLLLLRLNPWIDRAAARFADPAAAGGNATLPTLAVIFVAVGAVVFVPYACISTLLPLLCNTLQARGRHLGTAYGANTLSFLTGLFVFSWIAPIVNTFYAYRLWLVTFVALVAVVWLLDQSARALRAATTAAALVVLIGAATVPRSFDRKLFPKQDLLNTQPIRALKGSTGLTSFVATDPSGDYVHLDTVRMSGTSLPAKRYMKLMIHFPLLAQADPKRALLICFGVGNSGSAIAKHRGLERIDVVDLSRNILETAPEFSLHNDDIHLDPRLRMIHDDGRSFLSLTNDSYDLITSEPPPPLADGIHRLYSLDYYRDALAHLTPTGCMSQWLPAYQLPPQATHLIVRTFTEAFPYCLLLSGYETEYLLVGSKSPIDFETIVRRWASDPVVAGDLSDILVPGPAHLIATVVMNDSALRDEFRGGRVLTDDRNWLSVYWFTGEAPSLRYRPDGIAAELPPALLASMPHLRAALSDVRELVRLVPSFPAESLVGARSLPGIRGTEIPWEDVKELNLAADNAARSGRTDESLSAAERSLALVPNQLGVLISAGWLLMGKGRPAQAMAWFERCRPAFDEYQIVHYSIAVAAAGVGELEVAGRSVEQALSINPRYFDAQFLAGQIAEQRGDRNGAIEHYRRCVELKPKSVESRAGLKRLGG